MSIKDLFVKKETDADDTSKLSTNTSTEKPEEKPAQPTPQKPSDTVTKPGERYTEAE